MVLQSAVAQKHSENFRPVVFANMNPPDQPFFGITYLYHQNAGGEFHRRSRFARNVVVCPMQYQVLTDENST
jgi:hypothetical protein